MRDMLHALHTERDLLRDNMFDLWSRASELERQALGLENHAAVLRKAANLIELQLDSPSTPTHKEKA